MTAGPSFIGGGSYGNHGTGIAVQRDAAAVTGAAGVYGIVAFDGTNDAVPAENASLAAGIVTVEDPGFYCVAGQVQAQAVLLMTGLGVQLLRDGLVVGQWEEQGLTVALGGIVTIQFTQMLELGNPATLEVRAASFGAGGAPLVTGRAFTFMTVAAI